VATLLSSEGEHFEVTDRRIGFLHWIFGTETGVLAVGYKVERTGAWLESFYNWPEDKNYVSAFVYERVMSGDLYFCATLLRKSKRTKDNVTTCRVVWADLDACPPEELLLKPSALLQTSTGKHQAYWLLDRSYDAIEVEIVNKRLAYYHADSGCDKSGWDLTQYLRLPDTKNWKYPPDVHDVRVVETEPELVYSLEDFNVYPEVEISELQASVSTTKPDQTALASINPTETLNKMLSSVHPRTWALFSDMPTSDSWSEDLWQLELNLFNVGLSREEVFVIARDAACNKYIRDKRPNADELLWKEVLRAEVHANNQTLAFAHNIEDETEEAFYVPRIPIITEEERDFCKGRITLVEEYISWAKTVGDAAVQYHEAGAFVILSSLLAGSIRLHTSYGQVMPNLWFMILADTTLTRKTTAMDLAMDILTEIDPDCVLATDGSIEGLMQSLSARPGRSSVFLRDEFSGLLDQVSKRDYYAGMLETMTKLYDGKFQKRVLRKETITVREPCLILFTGGIRERIYSLLGQEHINSGFIPRFCFITADSDISRLKPLGPATEHTLEGRDVLIERFLDLYSYYNCPVNDKHGPQSDDVIDFRKTKWKVELTPEAWVRYNQIEQVMLEIGLKSSVDYALTPVMARLCGSGLKAAMLLAASEKLAQDVIVVEKHHIVQAFYYVERWKQHALNVVANAGKTTTEKELERIYAYIQEYPGVTRSKVMQKHALTARSADAAFATLLQRALVRVEKPKGKQEVYYPLRATRTTKVENV